MANEYVNKVVVGGVTKIDLTGDTVTAADVINSKTFHDKSGATVTGTCTYDSNTQDADAAVGDILLNKTAYARGAKLTGTMPNIGQQTGTITTKAQSVAISAGYHDGSGTVQIDATEQAKIIAGNILDGVTILGVTGTVEPSSEVAIEPAKNVTPTFAVQQITPSSGYDAMAQVNVQAIPVSYTDNSAGGQTLTVG